VVPNEGTWTLNKTTGEITFTPKVGFTGDPTPLKYEITDLDNGTVAQADVTIDYPADPIVAKDDKRTGLRAGVNANLSILANDVLGDKSTPAPSDVRVTLSATTVAGEGVWTYNAKTGVLVFDPDTGFTGDPTPITYEITDLDNGTKATAKVTVDYSATSIVAKDNTETAGAIGASVTSSILSNDVLGDGSTPAPSDVTIAMINPATGKPTQSPVSVAGEGTWTLNKTTGKITFTPAAGFMLDPTPLTYKITDRDNGTVAQAKIRIDYPEAGFIMGSVMNLDNKGHRKPLANVTIVLYRMNGVEVARTTTDANGNYKFIALPGKYYIQESQPKGYYDVSENEGGSDNDSTNKLLNTINVTVGLGEKDVHNDFVDSKTQRGGRPAPTPVIPCSICSHGSKVIHTHNVKDNSAEVHWIDSYYEIAYDIYLNGKFIATVDEDVTKYTFKDLQGGTDYKVVIVANNGYGGRTKQTVKFKTTMGLGWLPAVYHILSN